jgi:predicted transcriptional regulator
LGWWEAEVELTIVEDEFDPEERARLDAALELGMAQARAGNVVDAETVIRELRARR